MRLPEFEKHLQMSREIHERKNEDYASTANPLENFHRSKELVEWFETTEDYPYVILIGTKLARLANLLFNAQIGREPNNEPISDTFLDLLTYVNLWWCDYERRTATREEEGTSIRIGEVNQIRQRSDTFDETTYDFAKQKARECAGIFIPERLDAIEPFAHRLMQILQEYQIMINQERENRHQR